MSGWGSAPFGSSPYGLGTPAVASDLGGQILEDPNTGQLRGSRKIDPATKDYVIDEDTARVQGMSNTHQLVYIAVATIKGSAAVRSLGLDIKNIDRITSNLVRRLDNALRAAVQHIVNRRLIEVVGVQVEIVRPGVVFAHLEWRDLSTGKLAITSAPIG